MQCVPHRVPTLQRAAFKIYFLPKSHADYSAILNKCAKCFRYKFRIAQTTTTEHECERTTATEPSVAPCLRVDGRDAGFVYVVLQGEEHDRLAARVSASSVLRTTLWAMTLVALLGLTKAAPAAAQARR